MYKCTFSDDDPDYNPITSTPTYHSLKRESCDTIAETVQETPKKTNMSWYAKKLQNCIHVYLINFT